MNPIINRKDLFCRRDLNNFFSKAEADFIIRRCNNHLPHSVTKKSISAGGFASYKHYSLHDFKDHLDNYEKPVHGRINNLEIFDKFKVIILPKVESFNNHLLIRG